jgi:hypothetical protein
MPSRTTIAQYFQYAYFLRVSILFWLFLPILCLLDLTCATASLTRGILTLDSPTQWFWAVFFVIATNMAVLITARNIVQNGEDRFLSTPPDRIKLLLTNSSPRTVWAVLAIVHLPTASTLIYLLVLAHHEGEAIYPWPFLAGLAAALCFWYLVSLFYYWSYRSSSDGVAHERESNEPAALIFPKYDWLFGDITTAVPPPRLLAWIAILTKPFFRRISYAGYAATSDGPAWELHFLSGVSLAGIFIIYLFLYPLTSPVLRSEYATYGQIGFCCTVTVLFLWSIAHAGDKSKWGRPVKFLFTAIALSSAALFVAALAYDRHTNSVRLNFAFPTLASVLVLLGFLLWFLAGAAFFFDRYRLPVLTAFLAFIFLPKVLFAPLSQSLIEHNLSRLAEIFDSDHYFSVVHQKVPIDLSQVRTPYETLMLRVKDPDDPYIVVTAAGGGIQAAEWTAQVLASLEKQFASDPRLHDYTFHDHILLASGVSGGSSGLLPFLLEYTAHQDHSLAPAPIFPANNAALYDRITRAPGCSSLEAVGWGLSYHDFYRLMLPVALPRSLDDDDAPDRSWALASAFNRNLHDRHCGTERSKPTEPGQPDFTTLPLVLDGESFTLLRAARQLAANGMPAFVFNTTAAETGGRFLLSNYYVPSKDLCGTDFTPAESFLQVYGTDPSDCRATQEKPLEYADLPLATAARLSATFPLVSSGTRIPLAYSRHGYHFLDGGYFDNDGTSSALEFLKSALDDTRRDSLHTPRRILWIEIRDDDGTTVGADEDDFAGQNGTTSTGAPLAPSWTPLGQLTGIADALWNAGHKSISRRNRRELCTFELAYKDRIQDLHHVVFTIPLGNDRLSPLSWNLTTGQQASITQRANQTSSWISQTVNWVISNRGSAPVSTQEICRNNTEPPN